MSQGKCRISSTPVLSYHYFPTPEDYDSLCECGATNAKFEQVRKKSVATQMGEAGAKEMRKLLDEIEVPGNALPDMVNHPPHYTTHKKGIECIDVIEECKDYNLANVMKYVWRVVFGTKHNELQDLRKAHWYLCRAIERMEEPLVPADKKPLIGRVRD